VCCIGTGDFPESRPASRPCAVCKGTGKATYTLYYENTYYGTENDRVKQVGNICSFLMSQDSMTPELAETYRLIIEMYKDLGGDSSLIQTANEHIRRLTGGRR
jgi:hypothetical protein